jgi:hypothetical protein
MRLVIVRQLECQAADEDFTCPPEGPIPTAASNFLGKVTTIASKERLPVRHVTVGYDFAYDGGKPSSGGYGTKVP